MLVYQSNGSMANLVSQPNNQSINPYFSNTFLFHSFSSKFPKDNLQHQPLHWLSWSFMTSFLIINHPPSISGLTCQEFVVPLPRDLRLVLSSYPWHAPSRSHICPEHLEDPPDWHVKKSDITNDGSLT